MSEPKSLSYAALEEALAKSRGMLKWSVLNDSDNWNFTPQFIYVHPRNFWLAQKVLRGAGWHHKHTARWRYLVKRGARR